MSGENIACEQDFKEEKIVKKILTLLLALVMTVSLFAACGGKDTDNNGEGNGKPTLTIGIPADANVMSYDDNALTNWLEEQLDCNLEFMIYSGGSDIATQISTTVAARQPLPDVLWDINFSAAIISQYGEDGYFIDLAPYFYSDVEAKTPNLEMAPNFWEKFEIWDAYYGEDFEDKMQDEAIYRMTEESGAIYSFPVFGFTPTDSMTYQVWINQTWLDKLGLPMPNSVDSLYETLKAFKANDCNGNGIHDEIPLYGNRLGSLGADTYSWLINMFGYWDGNTYWLDNGDGTLQNAYTADHYREALKFINKLYKEGLMNPLTVTGSSSEMKRLITPANGPELVGVWVGHMTIATTMGNEALYNYVAMPYWGTAVEKRCAVTREIFITEDCPEENRELAFKMLDLMLSDEGSLRVRYGEPGVNWQEYTGDELSPSGKVWRWEIIEDPLNMQTTAIWSSALTITPCSELVNMRQPGTDWYKYKIDQVWLQYTYYQEAMERNPDRIYPGPRYTTEEDERTSQSRTNCINYATTSMTEFITGILDPNSDAAWNAYLKKLNDLGFAEWQEVSEASWNRLLDAGFKG